MSNLGSASSVKNQIRAKFDKISNFENAVDFRKDCLGMITIKFMNC